MIAEAPAALGGDAAAAVGRFLLGYAVVLATPGPNMLTIGAVATTRGFAGTVPLCLGVACGVGALAASCLVLSSALPEPGRWGDAAGRIAGALLLLYLTWGVFRGATAADDGGVSGPSGAAARLAGFGTGLCTAVSNPVTAAYFAAGFSGPLGASSEPVAGVVAVLGVATAALAQGLVLAHLLTRPSARRAALAWYRPLRLGGAAALLALAVLTLRPVVAWAG